MADPLVDEEMRNVCSEMFEAHQRLDPQAVKSLYAQQKDALFFWERDLTYDFERLSVTVDALSGGLSALQLHPREFRSGGSGDMGWFAVAFRSERTLSDGRTFGIDARWTAIAQRIDGAWLIVHDHASIPASAKSWD